MHWLLQLVTVPQFELLSYIIMAVALGIIGAVGWGLYFTEKKKASTRILSCPFYQKENNAYTVSNDQTNKHDS